MTTRLDTSTIRSTEGDPGSADTYPAASVRGRVASCEWLAANPGVDADGLFAEARYWRRARRKLATDRATLGYLAGRVYELQKEFERRFGRDEYERRCEERQRASEQAAR
jgi:hypothetical protein